MGTAPRLELTATTLDAPDPVALAGFYRRLLGWEVVRESPEWVELRRPGGGAGLSFQRVDDYARPVWPAEPGEQQMSVHLDIAVDDLGAAVGHARAAGAVLALFQPQEDVRVCLDPAGHPFCLYLPH